MNFCTIGCQPTKQTSMWGRVGTVSPHGVDRVCKKFHADILPKQSVICPQRIPRGEQAYFFQAETALGNWQK